MCCCKSLGRHFDLEGCLPTTRFKCQLTPKGYRLRPPLQGFGLGASLAQQLVLNLPSSGIRNRLIVISY